MGKRHGPGRVSTPINLPHFRSEGNRWGIHPMTKPPVLEWSSTIAMLENFALILASGSHANTGEQAALDKFHGCFPEDFKERGDEVRRRLMGVPKRRRWDEDLGIVGQRLRVVPFNEFMHFVKGIHGRQTGACRCVNGTKQPDGADHNQQKTMTVARPLREFQMPDRAS